MKQKILHFSKTIASHELISGSTYYFIGNMVGNVFAFLFNLFLARHFSPVDYGIYASLLSFFSLVLLVPQSFLATIIQFATKYFSSNETEKAKKLYWQTLSFLAIVGFIIFITISLSTHAIGSFLHVSNIWLIITVGVLIATTFISSINTAYLQSRLEFGFTSAAQALGAAVKLVAGIVLVLLGFGIFGALGAVLFSFIIPFFLAFIRLRFLFTPIKEKISVPIKEMVRYALPSMITMTAISSFTSVDVILAKHFLSGYDAGLYAGLSLIGKVIFYFTGIIPTVMFPILINKQTKGYAVQSTFYLGLLLVALPSLALSLFYFNFPQLVITIFLGGKDYLRGVNEVGFMALFLSCFSIVTVMVNFFLSLKQTKIVFLVAGMALLQVLLISLFHKNILEIVFDSLAATFGLIIVLGIYFMYHHTIAKTYAPQLSLSKEI